MSGACAIRTTAAPRACGGAGLSRRSASCRTTARRRASPNRLERMACGVQHTARWSHAAGLARRPARTDRPWRSPDDPTIPTPPTAPPAPARAGPGRMAWSSALLDAVLSLGTARRTTRR
jgi:hypothetical protein